MVDWHDSILVTGSHRSGTTWVGRILSQAPGMVYVHEPLSPNQQIKNSPIRYFYQYFSGGKDPEQIEQLTALLNDRIYFSNSYLCARLSKGKIKDRIYYLKECVRFRCIKGRIIKDPHALFLSDWLSKEYRIKILIMIRHPAAFVYSLINKQWDFDFQNFIKQPELMAGPLLKFQDEIHSIVNTYPSILKQGILLWKIFYQHIARLNETHSDWIFLRHEDLANNPEAKIIEVFDKLKLEWTTKAQTYFKSTINNSPNKPMSRDLSDTMYAWKKGLSDKEINEIKQETIEIWPLFYTEEEW